MTYIFERNKDPELNTYIFLWQGYWPDGKKIKKRKGYEIITAETRRRAESIFINSQLKNELSKYWEKRVNSIMLTNGSTAMASHSFMPESKEFNSRSKFRASERRKGLSIAQALKIYDVTDLP